MGEQLEINTEGRRLNGMRETKEGCDFTITVGSEEIYAHRHILIEGSDYFRAMFSHDIEVEENGIVTIHNAEPTCVKKCIEFIYTRTFPELGDDIEPLMHVACLMQLSTLCDGIVEILDNKLDLESFFVTWRIADLYDRQQLLKKCRHFGLNNIEKIAKLDVFVHFDKICFKKLLGSKFDGIAVIIKLHALLCWVKFDIEKRGNKVIEELFHFIDFQKVRRSVLRDLVEKEPLLQRSDNWLKKIYLDPETAIFREGDLSLTTAFLPDGSLSFQATRYEIVDGFAIFDKTSGRLKECNPKDNSWIPIQKMNEAMMEKDFSAVCVKNYIYVLQNKSVYRLKYFDEQAAWEQVEGLSDDHGSSPPVIVMKSCIYVIGGNYGFSTKSVEKYDISSETWTKLAYKSNASKYSTLVVLNDQIYCCGGIVDGEYTNAVIRFNSSMWDYVAPMKEAKSSIAAVAFDGKIYALGGYNGAYCATVESFDPIKNSWTLLKPMNTARSRCQSFEISGEIYAVGGDTNSPSRNGIEKYNPKKNVWVDVQMPGDMEILESVKIILKR